MQTFITFSRGASLFQVLHNFKVYRKPDINPRQPSKYRYIRQYNENFRLKWLLSLPTDSVVNNNEAFASLSSLDETNLS